MHAASLHLSSRRSRRERRRDAPHTGAEFLALCKGIHAKGDSATAAFEAKRVSDTKPTLAIGSAAGTYPHPVWGDLEIRESNGTLSAHLGPNVANSGTLEHVHYDTFRTVLGDGRGGANFLMFQMDAAGKVNRVDMNGDDGYTFTRIPPAR